MDVRMPVFEEHTSPVEFNLFYKFSALFFRYNGNFMRFENREKNIRPTRTRNVHKRHTS